MEENSRESSDAKISLVVTPVYKVYKYRYLITTLYSFVSMLNGVMWISTSPIMSNLQNMYHLSMFVVSFCTSMIWFVAYPPMNFVANYILDEKGLRAGIFFGTTLTLAGLWVRVFSQHSFYFIFAGQLLGAIGQPCILNAPQKLSTVWYPPQDQAIATTIASVSNPIGVGVGFVLAQIFVSNDVHDPKGIYKVYQLMLFTAIFGSVLLVPIFFLFRDKPPTAPSMVAGIKKFSYMQSLKSLFGNWNYLCFIISTGFLWGAYNTLATIIQPIFQPFNFTASDTGNFGALTLIFGLIGSIVFGLYVDKTKRYKYTVVTCGFMSILTLAGLGLTARYENFVYTSILTGVYGFFTTPVFPLAFELSIELSFPVAEAASSGLMVVMTQIAAAGSTVGLDALLDEKTPEHSILAFIILGALTAAGFIGYIIFKEDLRRSNAEVQATIPIIAQAMGSIQDNDSAFDNSDTTKVQTTSK